MALNRDKLRKRRRKLDLKRAKAKLKYEPKNNSTWLRSRCVSYANEIATKTRVYLDTKFWLCLRDAALGRPKDPADTQLLSLARSLVESGSVLFPFTEDIYAEVSKQSDDRTLRATIELIDELSNGCTLVPLHQRIDLEIFRFFYMALNRECLDREQLVWTKPSFVLGAPEPLITGFTRVENQLVRDRVHELMWEEGVVDLKSEDGQFVRLPEVDNNDIIAKMNHGKRTEEAKLGSFRDVYLSEIDGILEGAQERLGQIVPYFYCKQHHLDWDEHETTDDFSGNFLRNAIYFSIRDKGKQHEFPTIDAWARLHACWRWDTNRNYVANDLFDIHHAVAALSYFDLFLTERSIGQMIRNHKELRDLAKRCQTRHKTREAIEALNNLSSQSGDESGQL